MKTVHYLGHEFQIDTDVIDKANTDVDWLVKLAELKADGADEATTDAEVSARVLLTLKKAFGDDWNKLRDLSVRTHGQFDLEDLTGVIEQLGKDIAL